MHVDLFRDGHSKSEVYRAMVGHQARDQRTVTILDGVVVIGLVGALNNFHGLAVPLWIVVVLAGSTALRYFVDMSNRNFFMHRLDWDDATARDIEAARP